MNVINNKDTRARIARQEKALAAIAQKCGFTANGQELYTTLRKLEKAAHVWIRADLSGRIDMKTYELMLWQVGRCVRAIFRDELKGFFIDGDENADALKIAPESLQAYYADCGLKLDRDGCGVLAPDLER